MRIPHIINGNTLLAHKPSPNALDLIGESERKLVSENFDWNKHHCPTLVDFCVQTISKYFERNPLLNELPCEQRDHLLEILSTDLPLNVAVPQINDEYYWQRRYTANFGLVLRRKPENWTWKSLYLERHVQEILEQAQPQYNDEETFDDVLSLVSPYVRRLILTQLQNWEPPLTMDKEDIPEEYPAEHINFLVVLRKLPQINEFDLIYGKNAVGETFSWNIFKISVADCQRLGRALLDLTDLKVLRIHRSRIQYPQCQALMQNLIKNRTIVELDLSHCEIGDQGALCVAKFMRGHPTLKILNLTNNIIRNVGAEGLGFVLSQPDCADLQILNLKLNPLESEGTMCILRAIVRSSIPKELNLSGCQFESDIPGNIALMVKLNNTLKKLDVSNNWFGEEGGEELLQLLDTNTTLEWLDMRDTDITADQLAKIEKILVRNRTGAHNQEEKLEDEEEEVEYVTEYQDHEEADKVPSYNVDAIVQ